MTLTENKERPLGPGQGARQIKTLVAVNPASVVCEESIFANAVTTLGIPLVDFLEIRKESTAGGIDRQLVWRFECRSVDGRYTYAELLKIWNDAAWIAANPSHELAIIKVASENLLRLATRIRTQPWLLRVERACANGRKAVHIPSNATEAERERWLQEVAA